jgi:hypothetical protein
MAKTLPKVNNPNVFEIVKPRSNTITKGEHQQDTNTNGLTSKTSNRRF